MRLPTPANDNRDTSPERVALEIARTVDRMAQAGCDDRFIIRQICNATRNLDSVPARW